MNGKNSTENEKTKTMINAFVTESFGNIDIRKL